VCKKGIYLFSFLHFALALRSVDIPSKTVEEMILFENLSRVT
jgi:hypothetical protein